MHMATVGVTHWNVVDGDAESELKPANSRCGSVHGECVVMFDMACDWL